MSEDHLDKETSLAVSLTESGVEAKAKSRTVAAFDRLGGNLFEWVNVILEVGTSRRRAKIEGEAKIIAATADHAVKLIGLDDNFAARAIASQFGEAARKQLNKDAVIQTAIEDLQHTPPSKSQSTSGPDELSEEFISRFEDYASGASTEQLRERWGRVLASEIRQPGNFSPAVLRVIDEIDAKTASLFEHVCQSRAQDALLKPLTGELDFDTIKRLVEAGLIVEPGLGHVDGFREVTLDDGRAVWFKSLGQTALAFDRSKTVRSDVDDELTMNDGILSIPVYVLTSVGSAVSKILEDKSEEAVHRIIEKLRQKHPDLVTFGLVEGSTRYVKTSGNFPDNSSQ
ncbi:DUF2806 domain-containing protein [Agrobacterium tumefaciens]|uniref:DUF2806 domain-containing protein n=1 Tax=Agrobacterium tumefaciens TaxID=358 RepID=UPI00384ADC62